MATYQPLIYKIATEPYEFELIHRLNYRTFVEEIPQHASNPEGRLVDRFHDENTYVICMSGDELLGMIALRGQRPFSLDLKLSGLDSYLQANSKPLEIRLLAVDPRHRKTTVLLGMMLRCVEVSKARGYDIGLISGTTRQLKLYEHLGFRPFGPLVGTPEAMFQPMYLTWEAFETRVGALIERGERAPEMANFLPGPVGLSDSVRDAFARPAISHRSAEFDGLLGRVKARLRTMTRTEDVAILQGSGTLANDVIGAQLAVLGSRGLILANGEFGERLVDHAERFGLDFAVHRAGWGEAFDLAEVERLVAEERPGWLWAVHCETATGVLNDLADLKGIAGRHGQKLCMDCVSSIGAVEVDLAGVDLASGVSGKALASLPGLGIVFTGNGYVPTEGRIPRYLDLSLYLRGVPFTMSSNLLAALEAALDYAGEGRHQTIARAASRFRAQLDEAGLPPVAAASIAAPHVTTIALPEDVDAAELAEELAGRGLLVAYASDYLRRRNWIQVCLMGEFSTSSLDRVALALASKTRQARAA